jgi:uncharacterized delta-60 repeat protein
MQHKLSSLIRRAWRLAALALVMLFILIAPLRGVQAAAGDLDLNFGDGGKVMLDFAGTSDMAYAMAVQPDGKIVLAGSAIIGETPRVVVTRLDKYGHLDPTFGLFGKVVLDIARHANAIAIQPDGKIVLAGTTGNDFLVVRLYQNGNLDTGIEEGGNGGNGTPGFGLAGIVTTDFMAAVDEAKAVAIQPNGSIIVAGTAIDRQTGIPQFGVARYDALGHLDMNFGESGKLMIQFSSFSHQVSGLALLPEDRILITGSAFVTDTGIADFALCCLNSDGSFYKKFGSMGRALTEFKGLSALARALVVQPDGKIVLGGSVSEPPTPRLDGALARFDALGKLDTSFGTDGQMIVDNVTGPEPIFSLALQPDGKLVAGSFTFISNSKSAFLIERFDTVGALDSTFGSAGKVTTEFTGNEAEAYCLAVVGDHSIIAAGPAGDSSHNLDFALACYQVTVVESKPDLIIQDEANGTLLKVNTVTGEYVFTSCRKAVTLGGTAKVTVNGCKIDVQNVTADHRVTATINTCTHIGTATVKSYATGKSFWVLDGDMTDDTGVCR